MQIGRILKRSPKTRKTPSYNMPGMPGRENEKQRNSAISKKTPPASQRKKKWIRTYSQCTFVTGTASCEPSCADFGALGSGRGSLVNLNVQISWQAQHFVHLRLELQISCQAKYLVYAGSCQVQTLANLKLQISCRGTCLVHARSRVCSHTCAIILLI